MEHIAELTVRISEHITMTASQLTYEGSIDVSYVKKLLTLCRGVR